MKNRRLHVLSMPRAVRGLSLIELMIGMMLGLLVVGAAIGIFLSNRETARATENLGRVQENSRTAYELMARDVREAAGNPCVNNLPIANVVSGTAWWRNLTNWGTAIRGYGATTPFAEAAFGTGTAARLSGTEALELLSGDDNVVTISGHDTGSATFTVNTSNHGFAANDLAIACNSRQASVFQVSAAGTNTISHGTGGTPGNCTSGLGLPADCSGSKFEFSAPNSVVVKLHATRWYVGNNASGRRALYQVRGSANPDEVVDGVTNMTLGYLLRNGTTYVNAAGVGTRWPDVISVRISLALEGENNVGTDGARLQRQVVQVSSLRNRNP